VLGAKRLASIGVILFTLLTHTISAAPASGNGWVNEPLWREVYYGQSISGNPYIGETLVYNPGSWPAKPGVTHEWRLGNLLTLANTTTVATQMAFTPQENLAGVENLAVWTIDTSTPGIVNYSRTRVPRIMCAPNSVPVPSIQVSQNAAQSTATLLIAGATNPTISKSVGLPRPVVKTQDNTGSLYLTVWEPNGEDASSWPNGTFESFVGKNGQILTWSVYTKKVVRGWYSSLDCSSISAHAVVEFGVVYKEPPVVSGWGSGTLRLTNVNPVWGNQSVQTYQWTNNGIPIPGATAPTYITRPGDSSINLLVTGSKPGWPSRTIAADTVGGFGGPVAVPGSEGGLLPTPAATTSAQPSPSPSRTSTAQPSPSPMASKIAESSVLVNQVSAAPKQASPSLIKKLTANDIKELDPKVFAQLPASTLNALDSAQARNVTSEQVLSLSSTKLKMVSPKVLASLPAKTLAALPTSRLSQLTTTQKKALTSSQLKSLTAAQRKALGR
jgi:hypothetical protein